MAGLVVLKLSWADPPNLEFSQMDEILPQECSYQEIGLWPQPAPKNEGIVTFLSPRKAMIKQK